MVRAAIDAEPAPQARAGRRTIDAVCSAFGDAGVFMGVAPTGNPVEIAVIDIVRIADGRIAEHWNVVDLLGLLAQLGAAPVATSA